MIDQIMEILNPEQICGAFFGYKNYYTTLKTYLIEALVDFLKLHGFQNANVGGRIKDRDSLLKKIKRKKYTRAEEVTDFLGLRIIVNDAYDVYPICNLIRENSKLHFKNQVIQYRIDEKNSPDKNAELDVDKVGYRGVHFIIEFDENDLNRVTNGKLKFKSAVKIELQIKTELENFWANNTHDKLYKDSITYNKDMERRFNLLSGMLETIDYELSNIERQRKNKYDYIKALIDDYNETSSVNKTCYCNDLDDLDETSLYLFMQIFFGDKAEFEEKTVSNCVKMLKFLNIIKVTQLIEKIDAIDKNHPSCKMRDIANVYDVEKRTFNGILRNMLVIFDLKGFSEMIDEHPEFANEKVYSTRGSLHLYEQYGIFEKNLISNGFKK